MDTWNKTNTLHSTYPPCHVQCPPHARHRGFGAAAREYKSYTRSKSLTLTRSSHIEHQLTKLSREVPIHLHRADESTLRRRWIDTLALIFMGRTVGLALPPIDQLVLTITSNGRKVGLVSSQTDRPFGPHFLGKEVGLALPQMNPPFGPHFHRKDSRPRFASDRSTHFDHHVQWEEGRPRVVSDGSTLWPSFLGEGGRPRFAPDESTLWPSLSGDAQLDSLASFDPHLTGKESLLHFHLSK